jgi:hypothetical protein
LSDELTKRTGLTPEQRVLRAKLAARARWSKHDPKAAMAHVRDGNLDKYRREILAEQPDVTEPELSRRAHSRWCEHMTRIAYKRSRTGTVAPDTGEAA